MVSSNPIKHEYKQIQDTNYQAFFQRGEVRNFQSGKHCNLMMVNAEK